MQLADTLKLPSVVKRMRADKQTLCAGTTTVGTRVYWLEPSQKTVGKSAAMRAIKTPYLVPRDKGLFGDNPQSWRLHQSLAEAIEV